MQEYIFHYRVPYKQLLGKQDFYYKKKGVMSLARLLLVSSSQLHHLGCMPRASSAKGLPESGRLSSSDLRKLTSRTTGWWVKSLIVLGKKKEGACKWEELHFLMWVKWELRPSLLFVVSGALVVGMDLLAILSSLFSSSSLSHFCRTCPQLHPQGHSGAAHRPSKSRHTDCWAKHKKWGSEEITNTFIYLCTYFNFSSFRRVENRWNPLNSLNSLSIWQFSTRIM